MHNPKMPIYIRHKFSVHLQIRTTDITMS